MSTTKKNIKVRDLKPSKDAKGGGASRAGIGLNSATHQGSTHQGVSHQGQTRNTHTHQHGGGRGHS